jgi:hypothetical protein
MAAESPLFVNVYTTDVAILCVDASASTQTSFIENYVDVKTIFMKMVDVIKTLPHKKYRIVFWNSENISDGNSFVNGVCLVKEMMPTTALEIVFRTVAADITGPCLTEPHLGFNAIPNEWLTSNSPIYLITDGQIGYSSITQEYKVILKNQFAKSIKDLAMRRIDNKIINAKPRVSIYAVESKARDLSSVVESKNAAGGDMFEVLNSHSLTSCIRKFVSVTPNKTFVQINRNEASPGFYPYEDKEFSQRRVYDFISYIKNLLQLEENKSEDAQLKIAQNLSTTLRAITRDRPVSLANDIVATFCELFVLDQNLVKFILTKAIENEKAGKAGVFSNYRDQLNNLYQQATNALLLNTASSLGMPAKFVSFVYNNKVLTGLSKAIDSSLSLNGSNYPNSTFMKVAVLPMNYLHMNELNEQCVRQWMRVWYSDRYQINAKADDIIYMVLGDVLKICNSNVSDEIKNSYRTLGKIMLKKKRLNSNQTEYSRIMEGNFPIPNNGRIEDFYRFMRTVSNKLSIEATPLKLWYEMCLAVDLDLANAQRVHCEEVVRTAISMSPITSVAVPDDLAYSYECIISLDDLTAVGGYKFVAHRNAAGNVCSPTYLISAESKERLMNEGKAACCVCYGELNDSSFERVGPKQHFALGDFLDHQVEDEKVGEVIDAVAAISMGKTRKIVIMHGVVGSGKSTLSKKIQDIVTARGGVCFNEGTDKYSVANSDFGAVTRIVQGKLSQALAETADDVVVIIDTCGEASKNVNNSVHFNRDFKGWTRIDLWPNLDRTNLRGYFAWSLRNVLMRGEAGAFYLNPVISGKEKCINVHHKKTKSLFNPSESKMWNFSNATIENLNGLADSYVLPAIDISMI